MFLQAPESYSHCFELLREKGIIEDELSKGMFKFAKFRNVLVHLYWQVDNNRVIEILKQDLHYIDKFLITISDFVNKQQN
jgi:uncharacterized protein YutE (UPF0331/DUF86 family)